MQVTEFNKQFFVALRPEIDAALKAVGDKYGIALNMGSLSFNAKTFTGKIEGAISSEGKSASEVRYETDYAQYAEMFRLPKDGLGSRLFTGGFNGKVYVCMGLKIKRGGGAQLVIKSEGSDKLMLLGNGNFEALKWECVLGESFTKG